MPPELLETNLLEEMAKEKKTKMMDEGFGLLGFKVDGDSRPQLASVPVKRPLTEWNQYEGDNLFVMGNVQPLLLVYPARELLQAAQPVPRYHVQQTQILLQ